MPDLKPATLDIKGAVAYTSGTRTWIYEKNREGCLPFLKAGRRTLIRIDDLDRLLASLPTRTSRAKAA